MASPQIFEDLSSVFSILLQKKSEHTFLYYPLFQDYLNLLTLVANIIRLMKTVQEYNQRLELKGVFLTQYDMRKNICKDAEKDCEEALGDIFLKDCSIPICTKMEQTGLKQKPLLVLDAYGKATQQYKKLAEYILNN